MRQVPNYTIIIIRMMSIVHLKPGAPFTVPPPAAVGGGEEDGRPSASAEYINERHVFCFHRRHVLCRSRRNISRWNRRRLVWKKVTPPNNRPHLRGIIGNNREANKKYAKIDFNPYGRWEALDTWKSIFLFDVVVILDTLATHYGELFVAFDIFVTWVGDHSARP